MLSRSSAVILSLTSLSAGVLLGVVLARGGPAVSAQVAGLRGRRLRRQPRPRRSNAAAAETKGRDDELYDGPGQAIRAVPPVDRTFELVAKAVSPTVVHIVAQKTVRGEEGRRAAVRGDRLGRDRPERPCRACMS